MRGILDTNWGCIAGSIKIVPIPFHSPNSLKRGWELSNIISLTLLENVDIPFLCYKYQ